MSKRKSSYYRPKKKEREYLRSMMRKRPGMFRAEIEKQGGTPRQRQRRKYLKRLLASHHPEKLREWHGGREPDPVTSRPMTDEERARYFPEGKW
jgi:hypothetical protein